MKIFHAMKERFSLNIRMKRLFPDTLRMYMFRFLRAAPYGKSFSFRTAAH